MTYITSFERYGIKKGMEQGRLSNARENVLDVLHIRFGDVPQLMKDMIEEMSAVDVCKELHAAAVRSESMEEFTTQMNHIIGDSDVV